MTTIQQNTYKEFKHPERAALVEELLQNLGILEAPSDDEIQALLWLGNINVLRRRTEKARRVRQRLEEEGKRHKGLEEETEWETEEETEDEEAEGDEDDEEEVEEEEYETENEDSSDDGDSEFEMDKLDYNLMTTSLAGGIRGIKLSETWTAGSPQFVSPVEYQHKNCDLNVQDTEAEEQTHTRDKERCIITGTGGPLDITHIYPPSLIPHTEPTSMVGFWSVLKCFWPRKKVNSWKSAVLDKKGTESPANMLTFNSTVRKLWEKCYLALKPISISKKRRRLTMEFHWLRPRPKAVDEKTLVYLGTQPDCFSFPCGYPTS